MIRNLHIIVNDKFDPSLSFEKTDSENRYICYVRQIDEPIPYLNKNLVEGMDYKTIKSIIQKGEYDNIFFHPLIPSWYGLVKAVPSDKKIIWCMFGWEFYENPYFERLIERHMSLYKPLTQQWIHQHYKEAHLSVWLSIKRRLKYYKRQWSLYNVMRRIDYVAPVYTTEMDILRHIRGFRAKHFPFRYIVSSYDDNLATESEEIGKYIIVGNSAYPVCNHLDILSLMIERNIVDHELYLPLAYGDNSYHEMLQETLKEMPFRYQIQDKMIPFNEYQKIMSQCNVAIFPVIRQHSAGAINLNLYHGKKVFLYENSIPYKYLTSVGFRVFSIERELTQSSIKTRLPDSVIQSNRKKVIEHISLECIVKQIQAALYNL